MLAFIALILAAVAALGPTAALTQGQPLLAPPAIAFEPRSRAVTNWRTEAIGNLDLDWRLTTALAAGRDAPAVSRCVRLNNYWCIKRAGWAGEIAADADGHVAFASAIEGADVAALLLRRYYIDFGRHSAMDIVSRWAPAACGAPALAGSGRHAVARADNLATRGIGQTLRARFLASRGRRGRRVAGRLRRSVVPDHALALLRAPSIAVGLGEHALAPGDIAPVSGLSSVTIAALGTAPLVTCTGDADRIRSYAEHAAAGIARTTHEDLKLFTPDGTPTENLARMMLNMTAVEIGPLGARADLVRQAVARLAVRPGTTAAAAPPAH